jgi:hypothetical protein
MIIAYSFRSNLLSLSNKRLKFSFSTSAVRKTGAFKKMPEAVVSETHYQKAVKKIKIIRLDGSIKNVRNASRKFSAESIDALMKYLTVPISDLLNAYKNILFKLHPFEVNNTNNNGIFFYYNYIFEKVNYRLFIRNF